MKKLEKDAIKVELLKYLEENNLHISYNSQSYNGGTIIKKNKEGKEKAIQHDSYIDDFFSESIKKLAGEEYFYGFAQKLLSKLETQSLGVVLLESKEPNANVKNDYSGEYDKYIKTSLNLLKRYKSAYMQYVNRNKFLESNLKELEKHFLIINDQAGKEVLIEKCLTLKTFKSLDSQTSLYNTIQKHIKQKNKYNEFFPNIKTIDEDENIFSESKKQENIDFSLDIIKLNSIKLEKDYGTDGIKSIIVALVKEMNNLIINNDFYPEISKLTIEELPNNKMALNFYGLELNESRLTKFINVLVKTALLKDSKVNSNELIKDSVIITNKLLLTENLTNNLTDKNIPNRKNKI